jgi:hypothetical protein
LNKLLIGIGVFCGSTIGSYVPALWGGSLLSLGSIFFGLVGGIIGVWLGHQLSKYLGLI